MAILAVVPGWQGREGCWDETPRGGLRNGDEEATEIWIDSSPQGRAV